MLELEDIKITWEEIYSIWEYWCSQLYPELLEPVKINEILVKFNQKGQYIDGFDLISKEHYDKEIEHKTSKDFGIIMYFDEPINKGTLNTIELLVKAEDNKKLLAAIWIGAFIGELEKSGEYSLRGLAHLTILKIQSFCRELIDENNLYFWHHASRKLLPDIIVYYDIFKNSNPENMDLYEFIKLAVINCGYVITRYSIVHYYSKN